MAASACTKAFSMNLNTDKTQDYLAQLPAPKLSVHV